MDLTVLNLAVPALSEDLHPTSSQLLWIVDIYGFFVAGSLITMGTLGDRIGRRRLLMIGAAAFGTASIVAAFSTSAMILIATRALMGFAGATLAPSTSLVRNMFLDNRERTLAISIWITSYSVGGAIGPLVGGLLLAQRRSPQPVLHRGPPEPPGVPPTHSHVATWSARLHPRTLAQRRSRLVGAHRQGVHVGNCQCRPRARDRVADDLAEFGSAEFDPRGVIRHARHPSAQEPKSRRGPDRTWSWSGRHGK
jgi:hypothetical protein